MLKTIWSSKVLAQKGFKADDDRVVRGVSGGRAGKTFRNLSKSKKLKNKKFEVQMCIRTITEPMFLTPNTKETFNHLRWSI